MMDWPLDCFDTLFLENSRNGVNRPKRVRGEGYKMINMGELYRYDRLWKPEMELVPLSTSEIEKYSLKKDDLLFARQSLVLEGTGKCSIVMSVPEITCFESHLIRVRLDKLKADPLFYYYYFCSPQGKGNVQTLVMQVAAAGIRGSELAKLKIPIPPIFTQSKIAAILSAYDDLIENNLRRIKILEEMAQNLYREWFVNFRFPGHGQTRFVDSPLGHIPEGWEVKPLDEVVTTQYGYTESAQNKPVGPKYLRGKDINKTSYIDWGYVPYCSITPEKYFKYNLQRGDIVVIRMADPGKVGIVEDEIDAVFASYLVRLNFNRNVIAPYYLFYYLNSDKYQRYITGASTGTTRKSASAGVMTGIDILLPEKQALDNYETQITSYRQFMNNLLKRNTSLRQTRDLLLSKLISGEVDVSELDIKVPEEVAS